MAGQSTVDISATSTVGKEGILAAKKKGGHDRLAVRCSVVEDGAKHVRVRTEVLGTRW